MAVAEDVDRDPRDEVEIRAPGAVDDAAARSRDDLDRIAGIGPHDGPLAAGGEGAGPEGRREPCRPPGLSTGRCRIVLVHGIRPDSPLHTCPGALPRKSSNPAPRGSGLLPGGLA